MLTTAAAASRPIDPQLRTSTRRLMAVILEGERVELRTQPAFALL